MTLVTFVVMGVVLALLFVAAMVAVFLLNRKDRSDGLGLVPTASAPAPTPQPWTQPRQAPQQYGQQPPQQYGQQPPQQYGQQPPP